MAINIERVTLRQIELPLLHFFETSFGRTYKRDIILVEVQADGISGWGEVTAGENPFYNEEWTDSAWPLVRDYAAPRVLHRTLTSADDTNALTGHIRGHNMARGGLEAAIWDLEARQLCIPLWQHIGGGARRQIPCGVSIGIQDSVEQLLEKIALEDDYFVARKLYPNVDFYSGIVQRAIGIPVSLFTAIFALARTVGWIAQLNEMIGDPEYKIGRPRQLYAGATQRTVVPIASRP